MPYTQPRRLGKNTIESSRWTCVAEQIKEFAAGFAGKSFAKAIETVGPLFR